MKAMMSLLQVIVLLLAASAVQAQPVYKTPSGKKYHIANCRTVKNVSTELQLSEAVQSGLEPCKVCRPPILSGAPLATKIARGQSNTIRCKGYTKKGTRCQHMTSIANGYCFQHNPD